MIGDRIGADEELTGNAISAAVPTLVCGLDNHAAREGGASALLNTLTQNHDGSVLDDVAGLVANPDAARGAALTQTILGDRKEATERKIARVSGLSLEGVRRLLPLIAPLVMGHLGRLVRTEGLDAAQLGAFLSQQQSLDRTSAPGLLGFLERIDANDDGNVLDDLGRLTNRLFGRR
jgi:hypothetical protein